MKKIGVLGSGVVGRTLGSGFIHHGYEVMMGTRHVENLKEWADESRDRGSVASFNEAAAFGDILVLAVKGTVASLALAAVDKQNLDGKVIIDACNPISDETPEDGVLKFFSSINYSLMEQVQENYPQAHLVKAFSCVGAAFMVNPEFPEGTPTMFICGNSEAAKEKVARILDQFGWQIEDMGAATAARAIEPLAMLWCIPGFRENRWSHAFKLLKL